MRLTDPLAKLLLVCLLLFTATIGLEWRFYAKERSSANIWKIRRLSGHKVTRAPSISTAGPTSPVKESGKSVRPSKSAALRPEDKSIDSHIEVGSPILRRGSSSFKFAGTSPLRSPAIVIFCYNRPDYLRETLSSLSSLPGLELFTIYISQDGSDEGVAKLAEEFVGAALKPPNTRAVEHWQRPREPLLSAKQPGHAWLTQHYKWGLHRVFEERNHSHAVIVEDDMLFSPDFLTYFIAMAPLLEADPTIWCISTWNDNGLSHLNWENNKLFRTSYFPGLGWMLRRELWTELGPKFPLQAWDHWMRLDSTAKGRECICPEISRNRNIGERGANMRASTFKRYLARMAFSTKPVADWGDLTRLMLPEYRAHMHALVATSKLWDRPIRELSLSAVQKGEVWLVPYRGEGYKKLAQVFRVWPFPRAHHHHIGVLPYKGATFALADQRFCPLLPNELRIFPNPQLQATAAAVGRSCDDTCRAAGLECQTDQFWFINTCEELAKHYPCEAGCAVEIGPDVPNYVVETSLSTYRACLVTQAEPQCSASHHSTRRLCPCALTH